MNTKEDMKEQPSSMMSLLSWLSEVTNQRSSIASVKELKSCSVLLVLCENLLSKERDLRKRTKKTNDDDDDYDYDDNNNNKSPSDSVLLHVALDELNVGGEYVKAVLEEDEFGILEVIQKLKEKYDLREEVEKLSKDFLHGYDDEKKGEEDAKDENNEDDDDDDDGRRLASSFFSARKRRRTRATSDEDARRPVFFVVVVFFFSKRRRFG
mmetsp:Transcript_8102/g.25587  ORF Transcript_8102/g.25587 Transcript_8102/m.25587 type:complete len:210 (-) Transcript_8102:3357-3986(-)